MANTLKKSTSKEVDIKKQNFKNGHNANDKTKKQSKVSPKKLKDTERKTATTKKSAVPSIKSKSENTENQEKTNKTLHSSGKQDKSIVKLMPRTQEKMNKMKSVATTKVENKDKTTPRKPISRKTEKLVEVINSANSRQRQKQGLTDQSKNRLRLNNLGVPETTNKKTNPLEKAVKKLAHLPSSKSNTTKKNSEDKNFNSRTARAKPTSLSHHNATLKINPDTQTNDRKKISSHNKKSTLNKNNLSSKQSSNNDNSVKHQTKQSAQKNNTNSNPTDPQNQQYIFAEGIIKQYNKVYQKSNNNGDIGIKANVIAKKQDVKIIANKLFILLGLISFVVGIVTIIVSISIYKIKVFELQNPPITITQTMKMEVKTDATNMTSIILPRNVLPNSKLLQNIQLYALELNEPVVIRVKGTFTSGDGDIFLLNAILGNDWVTGDDGYFYYTKTLSSGEKSLVIKKVILPGSFMLDKKGKNLNVINIWVESLANNKNVLDYWGTAPNDFLQVTD